MTLLEMLLKPLKDLKWDFKDMLMDYQIYQMYKWKENNKTEEKNNYSQK